jgi:Skp family chaperone for outer membrane proteins
MNSISRNSKRLLSAVAEVNRMLADSNAKLAALSSEIKGIEQKLKNEKGTLKPEEEKKLKDDISVKKEELESLQLDLRLKSSFKKKSVENVLRAQLPTALEHVAKKEGVSVIFLKESLAYVSGIPDLSEQVAAALDSMPTLEKGPEAELPAKP